MDNNNNNSPDNDQTGEVMSWVIIFILMVAFWPIGLILLLKKLNVFAKPAKNTAGRKGEKTVNYSQNDRSQYKKAANEAERAAREAATDIASAAREAGNAARQAISEIYADLKREFSQPTASQARSQQPPASKAGTWESATSQSPAWQSFGSKPGQSASDYSATSRSAASQSTAWRNVTAQSAASWAGRQQNEKSKVKTKKESTVLEKKSGRFLSVVLLLVSIALILFGVNTSAFAAQDIWRNGIDRWPELILGAFFIIGGLITFFTRNISVKRLARYKRYYLFVSGRDVVPISEIARASGLSVRIVKRDIQAMINEGYLNRDAYIDKEFNSLVLSADAVAAARQATKSDEVESPPTTTEKSGNQYMDIILELREINNNIADISISDKVDNIEELTGKIFRIVEENPEKLPQIRRFSNYYLPTTLKLLRAYATLEKQGIDGENITSTKESIERILDTLTTGYRQQLDQLFMSDAIDIAADINVLENLMQQDGLTENKPELKTMDGV